jgi:hypothetical protein
MKALREQSNFFLVACQRYNPCPDRYQTFAHGLAKYAGRARHNHHLIR